MTSLNKFTSNNGDLKTGEDSSSSSDDEMIEALKEATDSQFLNETLFGRENENEKYQKEHKKISPQKSLRRNVEFIEESNEFGVTQDFKNFVAKQLAKSLDRCVEVVVDEDDYESSRKKKRKNKMNRGNILTGIKLMTDSKSTLVDIENEEENNSAHNKRRGKKFKTRENLDDIISKCREVAVEPEWVLSKSSTTQWADRTKGAVYKYKKSVDGALTEID